MYPRGAGVYKVYTRPVSVLRAPPRDQCCVRDVPRRADVLQERLKFEGEIALSPRLEHTGRAVRLAVSLALWLTGSVVAVLGVHGWLQLKAEEADLASAAQRELVLLTTAIRENVENAIRDAQQTDVEALLEQLELKDPSFDVFVFQPDGALMGSSKGSASNAQLARSLAQTSNASNPLRVLELERGGLAGLAPLRDRDMALGQLVILQPATVLSTDLQRERHATLLSIAMVIVALAGVITAVTRLSVDRPLARVIAGVRRVQSGDLSARIDLTGRNEFAELAREFDSLTETLDQTRRELAREAETRARLETEMQRANRLAVVGELAATLAHEIGSPLQVLNGRARELTGRTDLSPPVLRSVTIMLQQTERVHGIIERLLNVARRKAPTVARFDVRESVKQVVELLSTQVRHAGVHLTTEISEVPLLQGDPAQIQQVLLNLLQNALRASFKGTQVRVSVSCSSFARSTTSHTSQPVPSVAIGVEDEGIGIPAELRERVFEPFFTAWTHDTTREGTGLGLAVVRSIVRDHDGVVNVTPGDRSGSRFVVHLPLTARDSVPKGT